MNYTCGVCELKRSLSKSTKSLFVISALDYETGWAGPLSVSTSALVATYCSNTVAYRDVFGLMSSCLFLQILWMISFSSVNLCIGSEHRNVLDGLSTSQPIPNKGLVILIVQDSYVSYL